MSLRTRLTIFLLLFGSAVLANFLALLYLARTVSVSLDTFEHIRQRQLLVVQMNLHLRDAESALYRYQINGEAGFKAQFAEQLDNFNKSLEQYHSLIKDTQEQVWYTGLKTARELTQKDGDALISLKDQQTKNLQTFLDSQDQLTDILQNRAKLARPDDQAYQSSITSMQDASRAMLSAVNLYLASPDETKRVRFTNAVISFRQSADEFVTLAKSDAEKDLGKEITDIFGQMQSLGSRLISQRDLQQSQYANFITVIFNASQKTIVEQIEPHEILNFSIEQQHLMQAIKTTILISLIVVVLISTFTIFFTIYLSRQINNRVDTLLKGAERVASGNLTDPVDITGIDEFGRLAITFNNMMIELANREERLRALVGKMAQIQDEERRLIGLDLHDGLTQLIVSTNMHLNTLNSITRSQLNQESAQELDLSRTLVKNAIEEARKVISELRPTVIEDFGLKEGLRRYAIEICENQRWSYEIKIDFDEAGIPQAVQTALFRIIQEAMSNIRKHAQTERIRLILQSDKESLFLHVQDWGLGFDTDMLGDDLSHLGLVSIQERVQMLGGTCLINSKKGEGTRISIDIPLTTMRERMWNAKG